MRFLFLKALYIDCINPQHCTLYEPPQQEGTMIFAWVPLIQCIAWVALIRLVQAVSHTMPEDSKPRHLSESLQKTPSSTRRQCGHIPARLPDCDSLGAIIGCITSHLHSSFVHYLGLHQNLELSLSKHHTLGYIKMDEYTLRNVTIFEADPLPVLLSLPEYNLVPSNDQQPDQEADQMTDAGGDLQNVYHPVVDDHFPWGIPSEIDLENGHDNDRSPSTYEEQPEVSSFVPGSLFVPNDGLIHIGCMSDLRLLGYRNPIFTDIVRDIDMEGWAAGFDDMFKFLKLGERFPWPTAEAFEDFCTSYLLTFELLLSCML